ncbi:MAG: 3-oxoacyl-ACP synthase III family protein [Candidatus Brocadiaceae bacterium]|nr:3-oxoacyl-ACP synthase III family protein [Candidatus Brocadiaceae bacterium]
MSNDVKVVGSGTYLPGDPIPFDDIEKVLGSLPKAPKRIRRWMEEMEPVMKEMLDIEYYHYAFDPKTRTYVDDNIKMATKASLRAIEAAGLKPNDIDLICYGGADQNKMPTTSVFIQEQLGIENCSEFSIHANCTSAYKSLFIATEMLRSGNYETALVVSSQISSGLFMGEYYNQEILTREDVFLRWFLCDGAGALVLTSKDVKGSYVSVENNYMESIGGKREPLMYNRRPAHPINPVREYEEGLHHIRQTFKNLLGSETFRDDRLQDRSIIFSGFKRMVEKFQIDLSKLRYLQINLPNKNAVEAILDEIEEINIDRSTLYTKLDKLGYCGPPMVFICIDQILKEEPLEHGDLILSFVTEVSKFMQAGFTFKAIKNNGAK